MANHYFRFKQFIIHQEKSAMKVCTDACLFGAWVAAKVNPVRVLDIGTGTGLLSLMIAQNSDSMIEAVEIDKDASHQAQLNFNLSPWSKRLHVIHSSIQDFEGENYDLIVSNPPFFNKDLKSGNAARNLALHGDALTLAELISSVKKMLAKNGVFAVLLPVHRAEHFEQLINQNSLFIHEKLVVKQTPRHQPFRICYLISDYFVDINEIAITIKDENDRYSEKFDELLKDYYL